MLLLVSHLFPLIIAGLIAYLTYCLSRLLKEGGAQAFLGFEWMLENTPALNTFLVFITTASYFAALVLCTFGRTSNHIILSLDILFFFSLLILIFYHTLKQPEFSF
jgi:hypothetical protein